MRRPPAAVREPSWETWRLRSNARHDEGVVQETEQPFRGARGRKRPSCTACDGLARPVEVTKASQGRFGRTQDRVSAKQRPSEAYAAPVGRSPAVHERAFLPQLAIFRSTLGPGLDAPWASCPPLSSHIAISQGWRAAAQRPAGHCLWHAHCRVLGNDRPR